MVHKVQATVRCNVACNTERKMNYLDLSTTNTYTDIEKLSAIYATIAITTARLEPVAKVGRLEAKSLLWFRPLLES